MHFRYIGKLSEQMSNFWTVRFLTTEFEPNFGFPHIPIGNLYAPPSLFMQFGSFRIQIDSLISDLPGFPMSFSFQDFGTWPIDDMIFFQYMMCYGWLVMATEMRLLFLVCPNDNVSVKTPQNIISITFRVFQYLIFVCHSSQLLAT